MTCTLLPPATDLGGPLLPVTGRDLTVPLLDGRAVPYAALDGAASSPALQDVLAHVLEALPYYSSVHRGAGFASQVSTDLYEAVRPAVRAFAGARHDDAVVVVRSTTEALNLLASAVPAGATVAFLDVEHHANLLPWRRGPHVQITAAGSLRETLERVEAALSGTDVALLAVTGASNVTGDVLPLRRLADLAHRHGARLAVDAAQLAPHRRLRMADDGVDYLAFSGHKLYAPFGAGVLVGRADWLDDAAPLLVGGGAVTRVTAEDATWATGPARHEAGSPNVLGAAALAQACRVLGSLPVGALERHEEGLSTRLREGLSGIPGACVLELWPDSEDRVGVVAFVLDGLDPGLAAAALSAEHGIGVRDGRFCAHPLLDRLAPAGALRASVGVGTSTGDVDRLLVAVEELTQRGPTAAYALVGGRWTPRDDVRDLDPLRLGTATGAGASPCDT